MYRRTSSVESTPNDEEEHTSLVSRHPPPQAFKSQRIGREEMHHIVVVAASFRLHFHHCNK